MKQTKSKLAIFEGRKIRRHWDKKTEDPQADQSIFRKDERD